MDTRKLLKQADLTRRVDSEPSDSDIAAAPHPSIRRAIVMQYPLLSTLDRQPNSNCFDKIVNLEVVAKKWHAEPQHVFHVHKGVLCFYSGYFRSALQHDAPVRNTITLSEDSSVVKRFVLWLYTRRLTDVNEDLGFTELVRLWIFSNTRRIPALSNAVIDKVFNKFQENRATYLDDLRLVYDNTTPNSDCDAYMSTFWLMLVDRVF